MQLLLERMYHKFGSLVLTHIHHHQATSAPDSLNAGDFFPWTTQKILSGETVIIQKMSDIPSEEKGIFREDMYHHIRSKLYLRVLNAIELASKPPEVRFHEDSETTGIELIEAIRVESTVK